MSFALFSAENVFENYLFFVVVFHAFSIKIIHQRNIAFSHQLANTFSGVSIRMIRRKDFVLCTTSYLKYVFRIAIMTKFVSPCLN